MSMMNSCSEQENKLLSLLVLFVLKIADMAVNN